ncbi:GntR family transcriptional regulator [Sphaerochaeta globosa]|uniref:Transcriptional regulator, GntR family n=1 Tax=Sphaerochaeta globosa (strain ATCC BAA-1886 / DSM 22777 / Buddy) TaxID=158189 RepID=F0RUG1_SPHGB|nr:GntR family transcriptional regulator [Sphaerochaeta globosa]ADY12323.1 transcriptional regulator, GntR family [Sphaerochaeta globosa str. Buddy]
MDDTSAILVLERQGRELTRDYALRCLEYNISHLHLKPGQFISEQSVCEQLGLSRTPIREAFSKLANEMLVIIYPQIGTCVAPIRQEYVQEARYTRWLLECGIIKKVVEQRSSEDVRWFEWSLECQKDIVASGDSERFLEFDNQFHKKFFEITNMALTRSLVQGLLVHFDRVRLLYLQDMDWNRTISEHTILLDAIRASDADKAYHALDIHLGRVLTDMDILSKKYPEYFKA